MANLVLRPRGAVPGAIARAFVFLLCSCAPPEFNNVMDRNSDEFTVLSALTAATPRLESSATSLALVEGTPGVRAGTPGSYTIRMTSAPSDAVNLEIAFDASLITVNGMTTSPLTLSFDATNWTTTHTITVAAVADTITGGARNATITHSLSGATAGLTAPADIAVSIRDDELRIFITTTVYTGNLGGISGADNICMTDANYPGTGTYRALIADNVNRRACETSNCPGGTSEHIDWVMYPDTEYRRADGTTSITTTNAAGIHNFSGGLTNTFGTGGDECWTGMIGGWIHSGQDCSQWTVAGGTGTRGAVNQNNGQMLDFGGGPCAAASFGLYCVEQ